MAQMLQGDTSVKNMYSTRSWFNHNAPAVDSMSRDCLQDLTWLLHFVNDWELNESDFEWNEVLTSQSVVTTITMITLLLIVSSGR